MSAGLAIVAAAGLFVAGMWGGDIVRDIADRGRAPPFYSWWNTATALIIGGLCLAGALHYAR